MNKKVIPDSEIRNIISLYNDGESCKKIGKNLEHSSGFIQKILKNAGCKLRTRSESITLAHQKGGSSWSRKYNIDESVFETVTEESAYWIGFLMADGCIYKNIVKLTLQHRDHNHIEKFREFLKSTHPISTKNVKASSNGKFYKQSIFAFGSVKIVESLKKFGITPKKSLTASVKKLENNRHFWRGVIDGDGTIGLDKRYKTIFISLIGSKSITEQFLNFVRGFGETKAEVRAIKNSKAFQVSISGNLAAEIIERLYNGSIIFLERKFQIFQDIKKRRAEINQSRVDLDELTTKVGRLYLKGVSGVKIANELDVSSSSVYEHLKRYERLTGQNCPRRFKTRQLPTGKRYRLKGKCKDCGKETALNRSRCDFHLEKARNYWRKKTTVKIYVITLISLFLAL